MTTTVTTRLSLTAEDRAIRKTWADHFGPWDRMRAEAKRNGGKVLILFGDWSGYRSSQQRITHVDWISRKRAEGMKLRTVQFSDNTTMRVWTEELTLAEVLTRKLARRPSYDKLIYDAMASGEERYAV
jgi:hypothetical protein